MAHVLVVGGIGMLKKVSLFMAQHDNVVSVVTQSSEALEAIMAEAPSMKGKINPISVDFDDTTSLQHLVAEAMDEYGPAMLAVNFLDDDALQAADVIAEVLNEKSPVCRFFDILPGGHGALRRDRGMFEDPFAKLEKVLYRKIVLGFKVEHGMSRWLTDNEISDGVIDAVRNDRRDAVIGTLEPWEARPAASA
ncbi:MAG: hypothetical protein AAF570_26065 [Bacteroidota bacterium]